MQINYPSLIFGYLLISFVWYNIKLVIYRYKHPESYNYWDNSVFWLVDGLIWPISVPFYLFGLFFQEIVEPIFQFIGKSFIFIHRQHIKFIDKVADRIIKGKNKC